MDSKDRSPSRLSPDYPLNSVEVSRMPVLESRLHFARALILATLAMIPVVRPVAAQDLPLAQVLPDLILREIVLESSTASTGFPHTAHFQPGVNEPNNPVVAIVEGFNS